MHIRCLRIRVLVGLALVCAAVDAGAQDRLYLDGSEIGAFGRFAERIGPSNGLEGRLIAGGRIAVHDNRVVDLRTGAERALPTGTTVVALDPARPRLIVASTPSAPVATLDVSLFDPLSGTLTLLTSSACASSTIGSIVTNSSYAYSAQVVFVSRCAAAQTVQDVVAIDVQSTPPVLRVLAIPPTQGGALTASPDGRRLYFSLSAGFFGVGSTTAYDVATGAIVGVGGTNGEIVWDEARDRLFVVSRTGLETVLVSAFDRDLQFLGAAELFSRICTARLQISPHTGRIYVSTDGTTNTTAEPAKLRAFAGEPLALTASAFLPPPSGPTCAGAVLRTAPGPPREVRASVTGRDVTLDWQNVGAASSFVLDVGLQPGRTDLSVFLGSSQSAGFANVPPGTYYLRVRGGNEFGGGRPSEEIAIVVPEREQERDHAHLANGDSHSDRAGPGVRGRTGRGSGPALH